MHGHLNVKLITNFCTENCAEEFVLCLTVSVGPSGRAV